MTSRPVGSAFKYASLGVCACSNGGQWGLTCGSWGSVVFRSIVLVFGSEGAGERERESRALAKTVG